MSHKESKLRKLIREEVRSILEEDHQIEIGSVVSLKKDIDKGKEGNEAIVVGRSQKNYDWKILLKRDLQGYVSVGELLVSSEEIEPIGRTLSDEELDDIYSGRGYETWV